MPWPSPAWADHVGPLRDAPPGPLATAFAGFALLVGAVVVVLRAVPTRKPGPRA